MTKPASKRLIIGVLFIGVLMGALDISIVGPAIPSVEESHSGLWGCLDRNNHRHSIQRKWIRKSFLVPGSPAQPSCFARTQIEVACR